MKSRLRLKVCEVQQKELEIKDEMKVCKAKQSGVEFRRSVKRGRGVEFKAEV